jgi:hypothetical protein
MPASPNALFRREGYARPVRPRACRQGRERPFYDEGKSVRSLGRRKRTGNEFPAPRSLLQSGGKLMRRRMSKQCIPRALIVTLFITLSLRRSSAVDRQRTMPRCLLGFY